MSKKSLSIVCVSRRSRRDRLHDNALRKIAARKSLAPMPIETPTLRTFLRALQCRPSEVQRFRSAVVDLYRRRRDDTPPEELDLMARDMLSYMRAKTHLKELETKYFPGSGLTQPELVAKTAAMVGLAMPIMEDDDAGKAVAAKYADKLAAAAAAKAAEAAKPE